MNEDFSIVTHCVVCREPRDTHPTESNNPRPLFHEGRACRDCDAYITAARVVTAGDSDVMRNVVLDTLRNFLTITAGIKQANRYADEMMQVAMTHLEAEDTEEVSE